MDKKKEKYKVNQLPEFDLVEYRNSIQQLEKLIEGQVISESSIKVLSNIVSMLTLIKDKHLNVLISWLKQDYVLDEND